MIADPAALPALTEKLAKPGELSVSMLKRAIRNIEEPEYWGLAAKGSVTREDMMGCLLERLELADAPVTTDKRSLPELFEKSSSPPDQYKLRGNVVPSFGDNSWRVYYLPEKRSFYVHDWNPDTGSEDERIYGPFTGKPYEITQEKVALPKPGP